jgi:hypothetical protein
VIDSENSTFSDTTSDFPWPPREHDSVLDAAATTWKESVFHPTSFFRRMSREFDFGWVVGYYLIVGVLGWGLGLFWEMIFPGSVVDRFFPPDETTSNPVIEFLLSPIILLVALFCFAGVVHLFLLMFGAAKHGYGASVRVFAFAVGPTLFEVVPFLGGPVGSIWSLVLTVIGLREAHESTTGRVLAAVLVPAFLALVLVTLLLLIGALVGTTLPT